MEVRGPHIVRDVPVPLFGAVRYRQRICGSYILLYGDNGEGQQKTIKIFFSHLPVSIQYTSSSKDEKGF